MTVPTDTTVSTRVAVTVLTAILATGRLVTATEDVNQDLQPIYATKVRKEGLEFKQKIGTYLVLK